MMPAPRAFVLAALFSGYGSLLLPEPAHGRNYLFENISDLPGGPGAGRGAEINDGGDLAFINDGDVWFYDRSENSFLNVAALPGAPTNPFFVKLNDAGNMTIIETATSSTDLWFFEQAGQTFTNISSLPNFPASGNTQASFLWTAFDLNNNDKVSFHSGDNNFGDVYVYDHATGDIQKVTDQPGAPLRGRESEINDADQVLYMGFPSAYLYDPATATTTNINDLPGGPGPNVTNIDLNNRGDVALMSGSVAQYYEASSGAFLDLTTTAGWPPDILASSRSDLSDRGEITFWREGLFVFDDVTQRFTQLNGFAGGPPLGGAETRINSSGMIALRTSSDVYLAIPQPYGDYDNNSQVDAADLQTMASSFGGAAAIGTAADGDSNRQISGGDLLVWQRGFGVGNEAQAVSRAIPEPTAILLALLAGAGQSWLRQREKPSSTC